MTLWEYKIEIVKGIFKFRWRKPPEIQRICNDLGRQGWELTGVSYDWLFVEYVLYFKRPMRSPTDP